MKSYRSGILLFSPAATILLAAVATEGLLIIVSYVLLGLFDLTLYWGISVGHLIGGLLFAVPLLIANQLLWKWSDRHQDSIYARFSREVVMPLCKQVHPPLAFLLALLSGFGEELFFRGVLNQLLVTETNLWISAGVTSFLFAYVHFIGQLRRFGKLLPLYTAVGFYLWCLTMWQVSLLTAMICHGVYNLIVMARLGTALRNENRTADFAGNFN